jgi:hypothetical protein
MVLIRQRIHLPPPPHRPIIPPRPIIIPRLRLKLRRAKRPSSSFSSLPLYWYLFGGATVSYPAYAEASAGEAWSKLIHPEWIVMVLLHYFSIIFRRTGIVLYLNPPVFVYIGESQPHVAQDLSRTRRVGMIRMPIFRPETGDIHPIFVKHSRQPSVGAEVCFQLAVQVFDAENILSFSSDAFLLPFPPGNIVSELEAAATSSNFRYLLWQVKKIAGYCCTNSLLWNHTKVLPRQ